MIVVVAMLIFIAMLPLWVALTCSIMDRLVADVKSPIEPHEDPEARLRYDLELIRKPDGSLEWVE
jgi:hypothetical protein